MDGHGQTYIRPPSVGDKKGRKHAVSSRKDPSYIHWLVGCLGFNGPLRQYFSLYRAVSQRERERREKVGWWVVLGLTAL